MDFYPGKPQMLYSENQYFEIEGCFIAKISLEKTHLAWDQELTV